MQKGPWATLSMVTPSYALYTKAYLESIVASNDCRGPSPIRQSHEEDPHASCHGHAHCRATALHLQQDCHQKGSEAAVSITWTGQT